MIMGLSRLSKKCQACPYVETCDHKRMETLGYLPTPNLNALNNQTVKIKVDNIPLSKLTDNLKPIINAMAYMKGYH